MSSLRSGRGQRKLPTQLPTHRRTFGALVSEGDEPFTLTLIIGEGIGTFTFDQRDLGYSLRAADKYIRALQATANGKHVEVCDLRTGKRLFLASIDQEFPLAHLSNFAPFFRDAVRVCDFFKVEIHMNRQITEQDRKNFALLRGLMEGSIEDLGVGTNAVIKTPGDNFRNCLLKGGTLRLQLKHDSLAIPFLDCIVQTGPFALLIDVQIADSNSVVQAWDEAVEGASVPISWEPVGTGRVLELAQF